MHNIKALEEEWKRYRKKQRRPWIVGAIILILFLIGGGYLYLNQNILKSFTINIDLNQSLDDRKKIVSDKIFLDPKIIILAKKINGGDLDSPVDVVTAVDIKEEPKKRLHIEVIDIQNKNSYKEVEKRFRLGHDPDDSLFLAKFYYKKGWYKKAEYWALQTNKINDNIEESWLIFAKAKAKRGNRNEAKRILKAYIRKTDSSEAKVLLEKIIKGKF